MASKNPFASPNAHKDLPPTPHTPFEGNDQTPSHLRSEPPMDPFLDSISPQSRPQSRSETPLPAFTFERMGSRREGQGLPREETFRTTTESLAGITASAGSQSDYEDERDYTEGDLYHSSRSRVNMLENATSFDTAGNFDRRGYSQFDLGLTEGDLRHASQEHTTYRENDLRDLTQDYSESDLNGATQRYLQPDGQFSEVDLNTPSHENRQAAYENLDQPSGDTGTLPSHRAGDANLPPTPSQPVSSSTLQGTYRSQSSLAKNPFNDQAHAHFSSSPATNITPMRALPKADYTPSRLGIHPYFREAGAGYIAQNNASASSLSKEVRLREAARQQDNLLRQERANDEKTRTPLHAAPSLRPSPVALKVAAQLIRDSPAGQLPIGPQAVLHSKAFWSGFVLLQIGLISMVAAITNIVNDGDVYQSSPDISPGNIVWLVISIVVLLGGLILSVVVYLHRMGHWVDKQQMRNIEQIRLVDRLLQRSSLPIDLEEGPLPTSAQTMASMSTMPRPRVGLYSTQGRFTYETFNSLNPDWHELYMTPEQLHQKSSLDNINAAASTPSRAGSLARDENENRQVSISVSPETSNQTSSSPLQPLIQKPGPNQVSSSPLQPPSVKRPKSPYPFSLFPKSRTPSVPATSGFSPPIADEASTINAQPPATSREDTRLELATWGPLEDLKRDIFSEHVHNLPEQHRRAYIVEQRKISEDRSRKIREKVTSAHSSTDVTSANTSIHHVSTTQPDEAAHTHTHTPGPSALRNSSAREAQKGKLVNEDGEEIELAEMPVVHASVETPAKVEGEGHGRVDKIKKMLSKGKLDGRAAGKGVRERIERLKEQSERAKAKIVERSGA